MTKDDVKTICEADDRMCWWAMVLFAELSDLMHAHEKQPDYADQKTLWPLIKAKVNEFQGLVLQRAKGKASGQLSFLDGIEKRIKVLEKKAGVEPACATNE